MVRDMQHCCYYLSLEGVHWDKVKCDKICRSNPVENLIWVCNNILFHRFQTKGIAANPTTNLVFPFAQGLSLRFILKL